MSQIVKPGILDPGRFTDAIPKRQCFHQRAHDLEALDSGVGRLQSLEIAHGPYQQLELAVVGQSLSCGSWDLRIMHPACRTCWR